MGFCSSRNLPLLRSISAKLVVVYCFKTNRALDDALGVNSVDYIEQPIIKLLDAAGVTEEARLKLERLFEVSLSYGGSASTLKYQKTRMNTAVESAVSACTGDSDGVKLLAACKYIAGHCYFRQDSGSTAYDALVRESADSRGMALAYKALCNKLNIQCDVVDGLLNSADHWWNIVKIGDDYYHVDVSRCLSDGYDAAFLRSDKDIWGLYKWDTANYPECHGTLTYAGLSS